MDIDPRLNEIDDCLYRVAARVLVVNDNKILLVKEADDDWWALPGGGIDHGESIEHAITREVEEELGAPTSEISSDFEIVYYNLGNVVNTVPRMNLFFKVSVPETSIKKPTMCLNGDGLRKKSSLHKNFILPMTRTNLPR